MNLWLRLFWVYCSSLFRPRLKIMGTSNIKLCVFPNDLDVYGHMNNGRYLTLMDLGRIDLIWRTPMGRISKKHHWNPLVAGISVRYKKSLTVFKVFELHTKVLSWDEKWFYIEQKFMRKGRVYAHAYVKGLFRGAEGNISPIRVWNESGDREGIISSPAPFEKDIFV